MTAVTPNCPVRTPGEAYVWLAAMGLTIGLAMILSLLGLVVVQGFSAFWPRRVVQVTLIEDSPQALQGARQFGGQLVKRQLRTDPGAADEADPERQKEEWQLFVGNKDVYGLAFKFIDRDQVLEIEHPPDVLRLSLIHI